MKTNPLILLVFLLFLSLTCLADHASCEEKVVKIGVVIPLSGSLSSTGEEIRDGVKLAEDIVNKAFPNTDLEIGKWEGIPPEGTKIKFVFADHAADPERGAEAARRLIKEEGVAALMGCWNSSVTLPVSEVAEEHGIPMINSDSSSPRLVRRGLEWFWHSNLHVELFAEEVYKLLDKLPDLGYTGVSSKRELFRIALIAENTGWGAAVKDVLGKAAERYGYKVLETVAYSPKEPDELANLKKIAAAKPDVVILMSYVSDAVLYMKAFKSLKFSPKMIIGFSGGFEEDGFTEALGRDAEGVVVVQHFFLKGLMKSKRAVARINALYEKRSGRKLSTASALGFTGAQIWAHVFRKAGSAEPEALRKAIKGIHISGKELIMPWHGVRYEDFGKDKGQNRLCISAIVQIQKGEREVVFPSDVATSRIMFPFPKWK